jgi:hypothetical protein
MQLFEKSKFINQTNFYNKLSEKSEQLFKKKDADYKKRRRKSTHTDARKNSFTETQQWKAVIFVAVFPFFSRATTNIRKTEYCNR